MKIEVLPTGSRITLPCGTVIEGAPHDTPEYRATAERLGYGEDTLAMCQDHDPLHCRVVELIGLEVSYGMLDAAGLLEEKDREIAQAEETAVCALQRFLRLAGGRVP